MSGMERVEKTETALTQHPSAKAGVGSTEVMGIGWSGESEEKVN
jgi:hypothetical protein